MSSILSTFVGRRVNIPASGSFELFTITAIDPVTLLVSAIGENNPNVTRSFKLADLKSQDTTDGVFENLLARVIALENK